MNRKFQKYVKKNARMVPLVWNVPTNVAAIVWMILRVIKRLVFVIEDAVQGTLTVTAAQVSDYNYFLQVHKNVSF